MSLTARDPDALDAAFIPWAALGFSILVALAAPQYAAWFGNTMPKLSSWYLSCYPVWIVVNALAAIVQFLVKNMRSSADGFIKKLDTMLSAVSVLSVVVGVLALILPEMHARGFF